MSLIWIPLTPGTKSPTKEADGWAVPEYKGVDFTHDRIGLRLDDFIVVDCDDEDAKDWWLKTIDQPFLHTWVRKTPHGYHFFYKRTYSNLRVRATSKLHPKIDLKLGVGHYVVFRADGYYTINDEYDSGQAMVFDPAWVPERTEEKWDGPEWDEMPDGIGDNSMISIAGTMRRWGMSEQAISKSLAAITNVVMTRDPMPLKSIRRIARQAAKFNPEEAKSVICPHCGEEVEFR